jgi:hypothetical protein
LNCGVALDDILTVVCETGRISFRRVDILERDGEVDDIKIKVVNAPVFELLLAYGLDSVVVVEGVPKLGDEEEIFSLHNTLFDGTGNSLTRLDFITIVCNCR